jgi:hypothetical protein
MLAFLYSIIHTPPLLTNEGKERERRGGGVALAQFILSNSGVIKGLGSEMKGYAYHVPIQSNQLILGERN